MSDPIPTAFDFLRADDVVAHLGANLAIQFQVEGETFDSETMRKHVSKRAAIAVVRQMLVDEAERISK